MAARLRMETRRIFGFSNKARLNAALVAALRESESRCETCQDIAREIDSTVSGGEYAESPGFPGKTIQKLDAHFKFHWKDEYELVELSGRKG